MAAATTSAHSIAFDTVSIAPSISMPWTTVPTTMTIANSIWARRQVRGDTTLNFTVAVTNPWPVGKYKVIRIENDQVLSLLGLERREGLRYSLEEIFPKLPDFRKAADRVVMMDGGAIIEEGTPEHFFEAPEQERTKQFLSKIL